MQKIFHKKPKLFYYNYHRAQWLSAATDGLDYGRLNFDLSSYVVGNPNLSKKALFLSFAEFTKRS